MSKEKMVFHCDVTMGGVKIPKGTFVRQKEWVGLTDEEIAEVVQPAGFGRKEDYLTFGDSYVAFMSAVNHLVKNIEAKLKEKNT